MKIKLFPFVLVLLVNLTVAKEVFLDSRDSTEYPVVKIGKQHWMAKNLAYLPEVSLKNVESDTSAMYYIYNGNTEVVATAKQEKAYQSCGALYNWISAQTACPEGWRLPNDADWNELIAFGGDSIGYKLKSKDDGRGGDLFGFNATPSGSYSQEGFYDGGYKASWWSASALDDYNGNYYHLSYDSDKFVRYQVSKANGFSVRCIKTSTKTQKP
ncbi:MAG: hypothetical protein GX801_08085 [Fibrobacter sp.]|nr:hypothetical protein [Fibrobacter sp.]